MHAHFLVGGFTPSGSLQHALETVLDKRTYQVYTDPEITSFLQWAQQNRHRIDCLVLEFSSDLATPLEQLKEQDILLPVLLVDLASNVVCDSDAEDHAPTNVIQVSASCQTLAVSYHEKVICVAASDLRQLDNYIQQAISQFLKLPYGQPATEDVAPPSADDPHFTLSLQQQRLAEKLRERLGYMGVFYKRDPSNFVRNLDPEQRAALFAQLRKDYRLLVLSYFKDNSSLNDKIDSLVNTAFFADVSVSKIVEIHMELMETFAKQLKLEGRSEEILLDYRLTLIDVIAHLCEMYRRSIPRETFER
ncbi:circadian clock protein KaiA [Leptolyngbya iicbica]|uniref:Circadian clock oscillator protein KaiA n=2 Tax=Cyanophyceae TaxID=3028117 RepID=A0A4Q7EGM4_9CYAN|nr:circadian clock protein KaiA [Leptolyngbya sp. LK]RZM82237.1 circadian clock protein KaiA [Leptolyngbya sp. LK]